MQRTVGGCEPAASGRGASSPPRPAPRPPDGGTAGVGCGGGAGAARAALIGAFPAAIVGAVVSRWVGGPVLLVLSGLVLLVVGVRIIRPGRAVTVEVAAARRASTSFVVLAATGVGFAAGLLANGGGFLLVPIFLLAPGLDMNEAAGTSLVVAVALTLPTLVTALGDIDWLIAGVFATGLVPGAVVGSRLAHRIPTDGAGAATERTGGVGVAEPFS